MRWEDDAACRDVPAETFFPNLAQRADAAAAIGTWCRTCNDRPESMKMTKKALII